MQVVLSVSSDVNVVGSDVYSFAPNHFLLDCFKKIFCSLQKDVIYSFYYNVKTQWDILKVNGLQQNLSSIKQNSECR